jgi:hypothetical protein
MEEMTPSTLTIYFPSNPPPPRAQMDGKRERQEGPKLEHVRPLYGQKVVSMANQNAQLIIIQNGLLPGANKKKKTQSQNLVAATLGPLPASCGRFILSSNRLLV